jgi:hypothetical protein
MELPVAHPNKHRID